MKLAAFALSALVGAACTQQAPSPSGSQTSSASAPASQSTAKGARLPAGLSRVEDPSQVCMVNNQYMGKPQIPIEVEGVTYFGCCEMCKAKLRDQPESRMGTDPVTSKPVDKAAAIMVQDASGGILYFASEDTLRQYAGGA